MLLIKALEAVPASLLQPFNYLMLVWAMVSGYIVFGNFPDCWTIAGAAVIVASGLYIIYRERNQGPPLGRRIVNRAETPDRRIVGVDRDLNRMHVRGAENLERHQISGLSAVGPVDAEDMTVAIDQQYRSGEGLGPFHQCFGEALETGMAQMALSCRIR